MGHYFISEPRDQIGVGQRFRVSRRGTVNHTARSVERKDKLGYGGTPGLVVTAICGVSGVLPDFFVDDHTIRPENTTIRYCYYCVERSRGT